MAKTYEIVNNLGREFTYQLYANLKPNIVGDSEVTCVAEASPGELFVKFTLSGMAVPSDPLIQQLTLEFYTGPTLIGNFNGLAYSTSEQPPTLEYNFSGTTVFQSLTDPNGDYEVYKNGTTHTVIKDGTTVGMYQAGVSFADSYIEYESYPSEGTFSNIVLGP